jgi:hypothetical protein
MRLHGGIVDVQFIEDEASFAIVLPPEVIVEYTRLGARRRDARTCRSHEAILIPRLDADKRDNLDRHDRLLIATLTD